MKWPPTKTNYRVCKYDWLKLIATVNPVYELKVTKCSKRPYERVKQYLKEWPCLKSVFSHSQKPQNSHVQIAWLGSLALWHKVQGMAPVKSSTSCGFSWVASKHHLGTDFLCLAVGLSEHRPFGLDVHFAFVSIYKCSYWLSHRYRFCNHFLIDSTQDVFKPILIFPLQISVLFWQLGMSSHFPKILSI